MIKSPAELAVIRRAVRLTEQALRETARLVRPGVDERSLEGVLEAAYKRGGAQRLGFASIIKSGPNSLWPWRILAAHYDRRNREMQPGELVIFDIGCELDYYTSDIGRTFPVSGLFTAEQRRILDMEVAVADTMIREIRPGRTLAEIQKAAAAKIPDRERQYMATGTYFGHHIGLSSGDPSLFDVPLRPGMVITVEPWYYNHDRKLAVFTEDDILVTAGGAENLSAGLPRSPGELERLVRSQSVTRR
jgi:Xaa-Pro aminopeptidase